MYVGSTYIRSDRLLQTWDLYLQQWYCTQTVGGAKSHKTPVSK